jgi:hypothetical protein
MKNFKDVLINYNQMDYKIAIYGIDTEYDEDYIVQTLYVQHIAKVKIIILLPYVNIDDGETYNVAYIEMHEWNTCEYATSFIEMIKQCHRGCLYLYHYYNLGWPVNLIDNINIAYELGYEKVNSIYYSVEYYKNINWNEESNTMELVKAEFIAKQCAENVLHP